MHNWIIEADIYRLKKQARVQDDPKRRQQLERLAETRSHLLAVAPVKA